MPAWALTLLLCALFLSTVVVTVWGMSGRAKRAAALPIAACIGSAVTAALAYRHSADGEMAILWFRRTVRRLHARRAGE
jgi:hypothetical protein